MFTIRKNLSPEAGTPPNTRYDPDTDTVQVTPDGGVTWEDAPQSDPRRNPALILPATVEGKCAAAGGMIAEVRKFIDAAVTYTTITGLANATLGGLVFLIPGVGWLWSLALGVAGGVLLAGGASLDAAFTEAVYDELLCIFYCYSGDDGRMSEEQFANIQAHIDAEIGGTVSVGIALMFQLWGYVGLNNAGVLSADPAADCSGCACPWALFFDATLGDGSFSTNDGTWGNNRGYNIPGVGFVSNVQNRGVPNETYNAIWIGRLFVSMHLTKIVLYFQSTKGTSAPAGTPLTAIYLNSATAAISTPDAGPELEWNGSFLISGFGANLTFLSANAYRNIAPPAAGGSLITGIHLQGDGTVPALPGGAGWSFVDPI